ncbi:hypothetical protein GOBAR_AA17572 [Gossypium barbadense]|uniref:Uncharacterized protein n=1 Tax=Gossypium barbadense TaxID=3634 RepID=A0A2P5XIA8_GOSBA|nr:hypothetical protein GOBAR_AA17572 [Gossypium barbadense]
MLSSSWISSCDRNGEGDIPPEDPNIKKDLLVGKETIEQKDASGTQHVDDSFSLLEQDVKKSVVNGIPSIDFSERIYLLLEKEMATSVELKKNEKAILTGSQGKSPTGKNPATVMIRKENLGQPVGNHTKGQTRKPKPINSMKGQTTIRFNDSLKQQALSVKKLHATSNYGDGCTKNFTARQLLKQTPQGPQETLVCQRPVLA